MFGRRRPSSPKTPRPKPSLDFSLTGLVYIGMMLFMGLAAVNSQANLLFAVFGLMAGVLVVSFLISRMGLRKLQLKRRLPEHGVVGRPATLVYEFQNAKRYWPSLSVSVSEVEAEGAFTRVPQAYMLHAAAGMTATVPIEVIPRRRGLQKLERYLASTSFPFGFIKRSRERESHDTLLVYPPLASVDPRLLQRCLSAELTSTRMRPRAGGSDEFYGVREFRTGDNPRWINWRRSARTGVMVSNEMTQVAPPRLVVQVDTFADAPTPEAIARVERAIAMAASLVDQALGANLAVGLLAWAGHWVSITPSRGKQHRRDLLTELARLPRNTAQDLDALVAQGLDAQSGGATAVIFTPRGMGAALSLLRGNCLVVSAADPAAAQWFAFDPAIDFAQVAPQEAAGGG